MNAIDLYDKPEFFKYKYVVKWSSGSVVTHGADCY